MRLGIELPAEGDVASVIEGRVASTYDALGDAVDERVFRLALRANGDTTVLSGNLDTMEVSDGGRTEFYVGVVPSDTEYPWLQMLLVGRTSNDLSFVPTRVDLEVSVGPDLTYDEVFEVSEKRVHEERAGDSNRGGLCYSCEGAEVEFNNLKAGAG